MDKRYSLRCSGHTYVTLSWDGRFIFCLDNDTLRMEEIIAAVEKRTRMKFKDIRRENSDDQDCDRPDFSVDKAAAELGLSPKRIQQIFDGRGDIARAVRAWNNYKKGLT